MAEVTATANNTTATCAYCRRTYTVEPYHRQERLTAYCSHGCRLAVEAPLSNKGRTFVSIDECANIAEELRTQAVYPTTDFDDGDFGASDDGVMGDSAEALAGMMRDFFGRLIRVHKTARGVIFRKIANGGRYDESDDTWNQIAVAEGLGHGAGSTAECHFRRALKVYGFLRRMFPERVEKAKRRKKR